jgi:hypothetical protein
MRRLSRLLLITVFPALMAGCTLNGVRPLPTGSAVHDGRAIVVYGVGVESRWNYAGFKVELDEYSVRDQALTGNCLRLNRMEATVPPTPAPVRYFAFDVPPGTYVYSPFNGAPLAAANQLDAQAFVAPAGRIVYAGDFVYSQDRTVAVRRDLDAAKKAVARSLPDLVGEMSAAEALNVRPPKPFLCTP